MNCTECNGTGLLKQSTDDEHGATTTIKVHCFACSGTGLGTTVRCIICEKEEPRRHRGHFMCGNPECRREIVKIIETHKAEMREYIRTIEDGKGTVLPLGEAETMEKSVREEFVKSFAAATSWGNIAVGSATVTESPPCGKCGHTKAWHETIVSRGCCSAPGCACYEYVVPQ
jgi:hypothetical protein